MKKTFAFFLVSVLAVAAALTAIFLVERSKTATLADDESEWDFKEHAVRPVPVNIDVDSLADGIYPVAFTKDDVENTPDGCRINFEIFNRDLYDTVELHQMEVGDYIEIDGELVKISTLSMDGHIVINGGLENGGAELVPAGGGVYCYFGWDDIATYTSFGKVALTVPSTLTFEDKGNVSESMAGVTVPGDELYDYLKTVDFGSFDQYSVRLGISNGMVSEFRRIYRP